MKKLLFLLPMAMLAFCLSACSDDEDDIAPDTPVTPGTPSSLGFSVTASMIEVANLEGDCTVSVNNTACTVEIALALVDAEQLSALSVSIVNLPDGATASPSSFTADFSGGQTTSVTFSNDGYDEDFVFSASVTGTPSFTSLTLDGVDALSGEVTLPETSDVTAVKVEFTTDPAGTTVTVGGTTVNSGDTVDFTDAVTFVLDIAGITAELTVTATVESSEEEPEPATGISSVTRVWGAYYGDSPFIGYDINNWRSVAMDDSYFYTATTSGTGGVYAISISTPSAGLTTMSMDGVSGGAHATSHLKTIQNGASTKILVCNLLTAEGTLKVYAYDSPTSTPTTLLEASTAGYGARYGDKFSVYGDWSNGGLLFWCANGIQALEFIISNGTVTNADNPTVLNTTLETGDYLGSYGNIYRYNDTEEYLYASANAYMSVWKRSGNSLTNEGYAAPERYHSKHQQSPKFFTFNGAEYMAYIDIETNSDVVLCIEDFEHDGGLVYNIEHSRYQDNLLNGSALGFNAEISLGVESNMGDGKVGLGSSVSTNSLGDLDVREINGETYIVAIGQYVGISLFKLNAAE